MTETAKSWCRTCTIPGELAVSMGSAEAAHHRDHYPDHQVKAAPEPGEATEPKQWKKLAPALIIPKPNGRMDGYMAYVTQDLYHSYLEARLMFPMEDANVIWPASHDAEGFYSVTE